MDKLTDKEEDIMKIIWELGKAFMKEITDKIPEPKPPYNTLLSTVRKLEKLGFVDYKTFGKSNQYFPIISKEQYQKSILTNLKNNYFGGSKKSLLSYFIKEEKLTKEEIDTILKDLKAKK